MTIEEMFAEIDLYGFDDLEPNQKLLLLNESYMDIVTREPWPFMEKMVTITQPSTTDLVSVPDNDLASVLSLIDTTNKNVLTPERNDVIEKTYIVDNVGASTPLRYYFVGESLYLYPKPAGQVTLRLMYVRSPSNLLETTVEADILIPARHHGIIVYGALVKAYLVNDDPQAAVFQNLYESRYQQMRNDVWMKQYDRTDRIHIISDSYDWNY